MLSKPPTCHSTTERRATKRVLDRAVVAAATCALALAPQARSASPERLPAAHLATPTILSPGGDWSSPALATPCPTFSWAGLHDASGYELVVFRVDAENRAAGAPARVTVDASSPSADYQLQIVLRRRLPAGATSWTPDLRSCLEAGGSYAWSLRVLALGATEAGHENVAWAEPAWLEVSAEPSLEEVERALDVLQRHRASRQRDVDATRVGAASDRRIEDSPSDAGAATSGRSARASADTPPFEPLRQSTVGPRLTSSASAPTIGSASLSVAQQLHLGTASALFKGGDLFLWDEVVLRYGIPRGTTALGRGALGANLSNLLNSDGTSNTALGHLALAANTGGHANTATGDGALRSNTLGNNNSATGVYALEDNTEGDNNTAIGVYALEDNIEGNGNTASGKNALRSNTLGSQNTAVGAGALGDNTTGSFNAALGHEAGKDTTGSGNILINSFGEADEDNVLRIGNGTGNGDRELEAAFIHGIRDRTVGDGAVVFLGGTSKLGTKSCGSYLPAAICPVSPLLDGPACDSVPPGSFCEADGECGTTEGLDNCFLGFDWYLRID